MRLPYIPQTNRIMRKQLLFSGLNKRSIIDDTELSSGKNLSTLDLPAISPREALKTISTLTSPTDLLIVNGKLVYIDGTSFYYDGVVKGTVTAGTKSMVDFNGRVVIFPDKKYYDYIGNTFGTMTCPYDIEYATVHYNRIFGIKGNNIYASKLGEFDTWQDYSGTELDSWATDVAGHGDFTGITSFQDHVVFFKRDAMFELYGYTPSQFRVLEVNKVGCVDSRGIKEVNGRLYFASEKGIMTYAGGVPELISERLNIDNLTSCALGGDNRNLYVSYGTETYVFDTLMQAWLPYMDKVVKRFANGANSLYFIATDNKLYQLNEGTELVEWEAISKEYEEGIFNKTSLKSIKLKLKMDLGSTVEVYVKLDGREWIQHKVIVQPESAHNAHREVFVTIPMKRATTYQIKLTGQGKSLVYGEREYYVGSERA